MTDVVVAGLLAGYGLAIPVGAVAVLMVNMTAATSLRTGAAAALGAATADAGYAVAAVLGGSALVVVVRPVLGPLRWAAFAILAFMAARILAGALGRNRGEPGAPAVSGASATASPGAPARRRITPLRAYLTYLSLTALNPWPALYFVTLILGQQAQRPLSTAESLAYLSAITFASASWQLLLAGGGRLLGGALTSRRGRTVTAAVSSCLILGLGLRMAMG
ncbi:LysE family transporter [Streptomyces sp. M3]|uniref:LysE family transporter n=1 Tax=Streptomyces sp. M3 TaxID=295102 RepID=UPI00100DCE2C|nr:LysE family transporter [Streptomyces sp. M3]